VNDTSKPGSDARPSDIPASEATESDRALLSGVRVVELSAAEDRYVAAAFAGKLLADFGADVIKVEPPGGDPSRRAGPFAGGGPQRETSTVFLQHNTSKRGVTLAINEGAGLRLLESLLEGADVFLTGMQNARWPRRLVEMVQAQEMSHGLVVVAVTPYGLDGPEAELPASPLTVGHRSGGAWNLVHAFGSTFGDPVNLPGRAFEADAGMAAALATLAALHERRSTGMGQLIDVSIAEAIQSLDRVDNSVHVNGPPTPGNQFVGREGMMACRDGYVAMVTGQPHQWRLMLELLSDPPWAFDEAGEPRPRGEIREEIREAMQAWMGDRSKEEIYHATQGAGVPTGPVFTPSEVLASAQEEARGFFQAIEHPVAGSLRYAGYSARFGEMALSQLTAPGLGQDNAEVLGPLLGAWSAAQARRAGVI
jgi:crotonobetainyl-CoA:carnitine CoA-transferase CaiB-like acyl-CoA transferase